MLVSGLEKRLANLVPMKPGENRHTRKTDRIAAKLDELTAEYFPAGGWSIMDAERLQLVARHLVIAESARDPVVAQRSTRCAELLLSKVKREEEPMPSLAELGL